MRGGREGGGIIGDDAKLLNGKANTAASKLLLPLLRLCVLRETSESPVR